MPYAFAAILFVIFFAGCATDAEDRAFFSRGWVQPERGADERLMRTSTINPP
jgi:hypothetical protein